MQNKLCDVTKCLTVVAAGVLSGRDRKKKLETGLLFAVLLLDLQISLEFCLCSCYYAFTCFLLRARMHKPEKFVQMGPLSE